MTMSQMWLDMSPAKQRNLVTAGLTCQICEQAKADAAAEQTCYDQINQIVAERLLERMLTNRQA